MSDMVCTTLNQASPLQLHYLQTDQSNMSIIAMTASIWAHTHGWLKLLAQYSFNLWKIKFKRKT